MTAKEVHSALEQMFQKFVYIKEFRAGTGLGGASERYLDAWLIQPFPSLPMERIAIEIKVSRADFKKEQRRPIKRDAAMHISNTFYFAAPRGLLTEDDIPRECGLIEVNQDGTAEITVEAPYRDNVPTWPFVASLARRLEEAQQQLEGKKAMTGMEKIKHYEEALIKWKKNRDGGVAGYESQPEPNPVDYGCTSSSLKFMAAGIREKVIGETA